MLSPTVEGKADSTTHSGIANGTITIIDKANQKQDVAMLNRDPKQAINALGKIFDKQTVQEQQQLANLFGQLAFKAVGDMALKEYTKAAGDAVLAKQNHDDVAYQEALSRQQAWAPGGANEVIFHSLVGGIMADLGGGSFGSGAVGAGVGEFIQGRLSKLSPEMQKIAGAIVGYTAAQLIGGNGQTGASTAVSGVINNGISHDHQLQLVNDLTYAINNHSAAGIVGTMLKWSGVDSWNYYTQADGWGESGEAGTISLMNAAARELGISFRYNEGDSVHHNINAFWGSVVASAPTVNVDSSTLLQAGATAVVVLGTTLYLSNGNIEAYPICRTQGS